MFPTENEKASDRSGARAMGSSTKIFEFPDGRVFQKSLSVAGHKRGADKKGLPLMVVEGYMDVIGFWVALLLLLRP